MSETIEMFQNEPFKRWSIVAGEWEVNDTVELTDVDKRELYRSPEEPSHVAWVGLWKDADGSLWIRFAQITGNPCLEPSYAPWYGRADLESYGVKSWPEFCRQHMLKVGPADALSSTELHYVTMVSRDNGDTWQKVGAAPSNRNGGVEEAWGYNARPVLLADGTLLCDGPMICCQDGRLVKVGDWVEWRKMGKEYLLGVRESLDNGKTWSPTQWILAEGADKAMKEQLTEEADMVELDDGRILVIFRTHGNNIQAYLTRVGPGKYKASAPTWTNMEHSGFPSLIRCSDGTIWYWGIRRHFYTIDEGESWHPLPEEYEFGSYYGKMISAGPEQVLCVSQSGIGDSAYPHNNDAWIEQTRFSYRRTGIMKQTEKASGTAMLKLHGEELADLHLRVDVRLDQLVGVAFRISPGGNSYYVFAVAMPGTDAYQQWYPPTSQEDTLAAYFPGLLDEHVRDHKKRALPIAVLARVDDGKVTAIRGIAVDNIYRNGGTDTRPGYWVQLQVKAQGDQIQAAANNGHDLPAYVGIRDATYKKGGLGLLTEGSLGEFKNLHIWSGPQLIRDLWTIGSG